MYKKLVFDHRFFSFIAKKETTGKVTSKIFLYISSILKVRTIWIGLIIFERCLSFILVFPLPIYSNFIYLTLRPINGFIGYYLRALYYSNKAKKWGGNIIVEENVILENIKNYEFDEFILIDREAIVASKNMKVGKGCHIAMRSSITGGGDVIFEDFTGMGVNSVIVTASDSPMGYRTAGPMLPDNQRNVKRATTTIKKDAWIPANVVILPGVTLGEGSVVLPNSVIRRNIKPWSIWGPEKIKKIGDRDMIPIKVPKYS